MGVASTQDQQQRRPPAVGQRILLFGFRLEEETEFHVPVKLGAGTVASTAEPGGQDLTVQIDGLEEGLDMAGVFIKDNVRLSSIGGTFAEVRLSVLTLQVWCISYFSGLCPSF